MKLKKIIDTLVFVLFTVSTFILSIALYVQYLWPDTDYEQLMNTVKDLTLKVIKDNIYPLDYFFGLIFFIVFWTYGGIKLKTKHQFIASLASIVMILYISGYIDYAYYSHSSSTFYEENYVEPANIKYEFPDKKRNLILIYLESFEQNFISEKNYQKNLIPNLSSWQDERNHSDFHYSLPGTHYSIAAIIAGHCGIPQRFTANTDIWASKFFLPQAVCFPEILNQNGYQTEIIKAADITYTKTDLFAKMHGYDKALGYDELKEKYPYLNNTQYQGAFGGINDRALFDIAKKELANFAPDKPFLLTLFSLDTHGPYYFKDPQCQKNFNDLRDIYMCTDSIVAEFVEWFKTTPQYQDTTIVIVGDHILGTRMKTKGRPRRGIFNVFLNLPEHLNINPKKKFATFDLAPTILESINIKISPRAFGLGRSMFAPQKTLIETLGTNLRASLLKRSEMYFRFNEPKEKRKDIYIPYQLNTTLSNQELIAYSDAYESIFGQYYLDRLNMELDHTPSSDIEVDLTFNAITEYGGSITFSANQKEITKLVIQNNMRPPYNVKLLIKKEDLKDNKLQLNFRNNKGLIVATEMGIAPQSLTIREKTF